MAELKWRKMARRQGSPRYEAHVGEVTYSIWPHTRTPGNSARWSVLRTKLGVRYSIGVGNRSTIAEAKQAAQEDWDRQQEGDTHG